MMMHDNGCFIKAAGIIIIISNKEINKNKQQILQQ